MKQLIYVLIVLCLAVPAFAEIEYSNDDSIMYLNGYVDDTVKFTNITRYNDDQLRNPSYIQCINSTCISGWFKFYMNDFNFTYEFIYDDGSNYLSSTVQISQELIENKIFTKTYNRMLIIDGEIVGNHDTEIGMWMWAYRPVYLSFNNLDNIIMFDNETIEKHLFFTVLEVTDQHDYLYNPDKANHKIKAHFKTMSDDGGDLRLKGLTGLFYNIFGNMPSYIPNSIQNICSAIQSVIFLPLLLIQYLFNFTFTFIKLIMSDWWYALLLLEIICIIPALRYDDFPDIMQSWVHSHVKVTLFIKDKVLMPMINLIILIAATIRNMFRI